MGIQGAQQLAERLEKWVEVNKHTSENPMQLVELAKVLYVEWSSVHRWTKSGDLPLFSKGLVEPLKVLEALRVTPSKTSRVSGTVPDSTPQCVTLEAPSELVRETPDQGIELSRVRKLMLKAAKEAARDLILREADRAKSAGHHELRANLLDDYVHMEQGLSVVFEGRR